MGSLQVRSGRSKCDPCPAGYFCPETTYALNTSLLCAEGSFCPEGTSAPQACERGTFGPLTGRGRTEDCLQCPAGLACNQTGIVKPELPCDAG